MRRNLPPLNALRAFEIASNTTSFTAAADELCVSQGAVSRHIGRLERHLGAELFDRRNRKVRLTETGKALAEELHHAFDRIEEAALAASRAKQRQRIRLGLFPTMTTSWLMHRLMGFQVAHPSIELQITCKTEFADADRRRFDIVSGRGSVAEPSMQYEKLIDIVLRPICSPELLSGGDALRDPADLRRSTTLHSINRRDDWEAWRQHAGIGPLDPRRVLFFENSVLAHEAAARGVGVALAISPTDPSSGSRRLIEPFSVHLRTGESYGLAWAKALNRNPAVRIFQDWLRAEIASHPADA